VGREKFIIEAVKELKMHAVIEEEIFYPTVRMHVRKALMNEVDEATCGACANRGTRCHRHGE
jgi:signal recognition particle subunit SEC65